MTTHINTFYTVHSLYWNEGSEYVAPYWATGGCGPGGKTIEEAHQRVCEDMKRIQPDMLDKVKFKITKTTKVEEDVEEIPGTHASFFMLKA